MVKTKSGKFVPEADTAALEGERVQRIYRLPLADPRPPLPDWLRARGLETFAVSAVHFVHQSAHLVGTFDEQIALTQEGSKEPDDDGSTVQALKWLAKLGPDQRFFLWVHYLGPHSPSTRKAGVKDFGKGLINEYDHEIATFDANVAPLLKELTRRQDEGEPISVIVSADHGEEFRQHRFHGHSVEEGTAHIPLFISVPGVAPKRSPILVSSVDVYPTVVALTGGAQPQDLDGRDLTPAIRGELSHWPRVVLMDGWVNDSADGLPFNRVAAIGTQRRLSWDLLDFSERAEPLPSLAGSQGTGSLSPLLNAAHAADGAPGEQEHELREVITRYLEEVPTDPRVWN